MLKVLLICLTSLRLSLGQDFLQSFKAIEALARHENIKGLVIVIDFELTHSYLEDIQQSVHSIENNTLFHLPISVVRPQDLNIDIIAKQNFLGIFVASTLPLKAIERASGRQSLGNHIDESLFIQ